MPHDPLHTLLRLREAALDDVRRAVREALATEDRARAGRNAAEAAIQTETRIAAESEDDTDVERFACWLKRGRAQLQAAETALAEATACLAHKRAELNLARATVEATAGAIDRRRQEHEQKIARASQHELDEIGQQRHVRAEKLL